MVARGPRVNGASPGKRAQVLGSLKIALGVERLDIDALGRFPDERFRRSTKLLFRQRLPIPQALLRHRISLAFFFCRTLAPYRHLMREARQKISVMA
jgi:hypothetical protein